MCIRDSSKVVDGRNPIVAHEFLGTSVEGKTVLIIDDMISSGESMLDTARELKERKAKKVVVCCTSVSYTHLDVYKRQENTMASESWEEI